MQRSDPSYKEYSFADHKVVYLKLEDSFKKFGVHYYLIGANARDVQMYKAGIKPNRGTADIDFAIMLPDISKYDEIKTDLKENGFEDAHGDLPWRLYHKEYNTVVDLLPYGKIAQENTVTFTDKNIELSVVGMYEVGVEAEFFEHPEGYVIPVSPAHGIVILKLISWGEQPGRTKDLADIKALLDAAWEIYQEEFYQENSPYADLFDVDPFDTQLAAARVMCRKMQAILNQNEALKSLIITEINNEITGNSPKAQQMVTGTDQTIEEVKQIFNALLTGIND
jgi:predicted nucleotidyltransferase